ncbi:MAG: DUF4293 family protein [Chitinophagales bacterium]|nr:DUF4293 family protein [Chitinophagales bacterium]
MALTKVNGMIQRIQTVWWLTAAILIGILILIPVFGYQNAENVTSFYASGFNPLRVALYLIIFWSIVNIFLFKRRNLQLTIAYWQILPLYPIVLLMIFLAFEGNEENTTLKLLPWTFLWISFFSLSLIFQILAIRAVKKDEALIKSMDRLR